MSYPDFIASKRITFTPRSVTRSDRLNPALFDFQVKIVGWEDVGRTKVNDLVVLQLTPDKMPEPCAPIGGQLDLWGIGA